MKNLKLLLLVGFCLVIALGSASANITIDETFDDGTAFTDLNWAQGGTSPTSATIKGLHPVRSTSGSNPITSTTKLSLNMTSGNQQGALKSLGTGGGKAWQLNAGQKLFWGQSGNPLIPSGGGVIGDSGADVKVAQVGLAYDTSLMLNGSTGNLIGSVSYLFGNTAQTTTTFSLTYELRVKDATSAELRELRSDGTSKTLGLVLPNKFSMLTTVWAAGGDNVWGTIPKTGYGMTLYPAINPKFPKRKLGWEVNPNEGSADGRLYPKGKGWAHNTKLTSSSNGFITNAIYSFLDTKPNSYGTTASSPLVVDKPWLIPAVWYGTHTSIPLLGLNTPDQSTSMTSQLRTWKIQAGPSATLYVDDLYLESQCRDAKMDNSSYPHFAANYRLHEFDQKLMYKPTSTTLDANSQYVDTAGLPVELSIFELR